MDISTFFNQLFFDYTIRTVAIGTAVLGIVSGALGSFAVLRRQSLLGDALSHAALPGVVLAFMITGSKAPLVLMAGAALAGILAVLSILAITRYTRIKEDTALGLMLSFYFGLGLMLLTFLQRNPDARQAGLNTFLFGQAATLLTGDILRMSALGGFAILVLILFWKEFKLLSFDQEFGQTIGLPIVALEVALIGLLVFAIVIGLQTVGVVLMSAMVVAPGAAARQWTNKLGIMVILASIFGAISGVSGAMISSLESGLSTGPVIVLVVSLIVLISLLLAPQRGLLWNWIRHQKNRRRVGQESVLINLYLMALQHQDLSHPHEINALRVLFKGEFGTTRTLQILQENGWVECPNPKQWSLTPAGISAAQKLLNIQPAGEV